jgi:hypothetical protein
MTNMAPYTGLALYNKRMKIEVCFRDLKSLQAIVARFASPLRDQPLRSIFPVGF